MHVSCLCGATSQEVELRRPESGALELSLDHSDIERHSSGVLCTSYYPIARPDVSRGTTAHGGADGRTRYFCSACGCHTFRSQTQGAEEQWEAATGVINEAASDMSDTDTRYARHISVGDTNDGGISLWLPKIGNRTMETVNQSLADGFQKVTAREVLPEVSPLAPPDALPATCACGTVSFHITRPNEESYIPHSGYPDLQYAACSHSSEFMANPNRDKWWIRANGTKYLAGTCACRSCRLISGFEIQTWTFVPRSNIFFHVAASNGEQTITPLDFGTLPSGILQTYESSPGVHREFCGTCGATVFWHDKWRPDVIDVSVGLLRAKEGARADTWLDWWTRRCSFEEETTSGRTGEPARVARELIDGLERGLRSGDKRELNEGNR